MSDIVLSELAGVWMAVGLNSLHGHGCLHRQGQVMSAEEDLAAAMEAWLDAPSGDQPSNARLAAALAALSLPTPQAGAGCENGADFDRQWDRCPDCGDKDCRVDSMCTNRTAPPCQRCGHSRAEHADAEYSRPWCRHGWAADPAQRAADPCSCGWYTPAPRTEP